MTSFEKMIAQQEELRLHDFAEWFFKTYSPEDPRESSKFHADLFTLIQRVYVEAQAPLIKQMSAAMALIPPFNNYEKR